MLKQEDIANLVQKNIQLIIKKFGGWVNTNVQLFIDVSGLPILAPQHIYQKQDDNLVYNGLEFLNISEMQGTKRYLLQELQTDRGQKYNISRDRGLVNLVLFRKKPEIPHIEHEHVPIHQQQQQVQQNQQQTVNNELNDARSKALFLFDLFLRYHGDNSRVVKNVLCNICECAYSYATQNSADQSQLCKLFRILKQGKHLGAFNSLAYDFLDSQQKQVQFLQTVNDKLQPQAMQYDDSWAHQQAPNFNEMVESLRIETQPHRQQQVASLREKIDDLQHKDLQSKQLKFNQALQEADESLDAVKNNKLAKNMVKESSGTELNKLREMINLYLLFQLSSNSKTLPGFDKIYSQLTKDDMEDIVDNFATRNELKQWQQTATLYDLF